MTDTTRREQISIKPPPITSHLSLLNTIQSHKDLVGTPQQITAGTPTKTAIKDGIPGAPSHQEWYGIDTPVATNPKHLLQLPRADSPAVHASLRLEAECGAVKVSDSSRGNNVSGDVVKREGGNAVEEESKSNCQESTTADHAPPVTHNSPPSHRTLLTNGLALPPINPSNDGTSLVPGGRSLKIPQTTASVTLNNVVQNEAEGMPRVNSDPQLCSKAEQNNEPLRKAKSCDVLQVNTTEKGMTVDPPLNMVAACEVEGEGESERNHLLMAGSTYVLPVPQSSPEGNSRDSQEQGSKVIFKGLYMCMYIVCVNCLLCAQVHLCFFSACTCIYIYMTLCLMYLYTMYMYMYIVL